MEELVACETATPEKLLKKRLRERPTEVALGIATRLAEDVQRAKRQKRLA